MVLDPTDIKCVIAQTSRAIEENLPGLADEIAKILFLRIKRDARENLDARSFENSSFDSRLRGRWARGLDLLALEIAITKEAGESLRKNPHCEVT